MKEIEAKGEIIQIYFNDKNFVPLGNTIKIFLKQVNYSHTKLVNHLFTEESIKKIMYSNYCNLNYKYIIGTHQVGVHFYI